MQYVGGMPNLGDNCLTNPVADISCGSDAFALLSASYFS